MRVRKSLLRRPFADLDPLIADIYARIVHHGEHRHQAAIFGTNQFADAFVIVAIAHDAGRRGVDAELVLYAHASQIIVGSERPVLLHMVLRHHEQRNTARTFRRVGQPGEHEVDDILGKIVFTPSDVDLLTLDQIFACVLSLRDGSGGRTQCTDIRTSLRLGQVHSSRPFAAHQFGKVFFLKFRRAMMVERFDGANAQHWKQVEGHVRRAEVFENIA